MTPMEQHLVSPSMNRLQTQFDRLYASTADGRVRALVLGLRQPADWPSLAQVWRGVQTDWDWPASAIAINGVDAFELWFSLAQPVPTVEAAALLQQLCRRYLPNVAPQRLLCWPPVANTSALPPPVGRIPALHSNTGRWAAFIAADLPAVFGDDPSLDWPPGDDAQADLLAHLQPVSVTAWQTAQASSAAPAAPLATASPPPEAPAAPLSAADAPATDLCGPYDDPRQFLRDVMNSTHTPLTLRIQAAQALLA